MDNLNVDDTLADEAIKALSSLEESEQAQVLEFINTLTALPNNEDDN